MALVALVALLAGACGGSSRATTNKAVLAGLIKPGTYRYSQSGSFLVGTAPRPLAPEGGLQVAPPDPNGIQVQHREYLPGTWWTEFGFKMLNGAPYVDSYKVHVGVLGDPIEDQCRFTTPPPVLPSPPRVGAGYEGSAPCKSFKLKFAAKVIERRSVTLDQRPYDAYVVKIREEANGAITASGDEIATVVPDLGMMTVREELHLRGTYGSFPFGYDVVSDLLSANPTA